MKNVFQLGLVVMVFVTHISLQGQSTNWYQSPRSSQAPSNIGTDEVYETLLQGKQGLPVVVAVIDSGVDIEHEDLREVIWVNHDEIPDNGIDDDKNGYIDDINGWNFIGGPNGRQVDADTYEMTRLYADLRKKFRDADPSLLDEKELKEYNTYVKYEKKIKKEIDKAKRNYEQYKQQLDVFFPAFEHIQYLEENYGIDEHLIDSISMSYSRSDAIAANILNFYAQEIGEIPSLDYLHASLIAPLLEATDHYGRKYKYNWNVDFDPRYKVNDNYSDKTEKYYGNNLVEGPDAMHGTHVAGIIAARRNNGIGINGIAENARIMVVRAVPNGDERDKDVANAIRYAVDNGASIINMSFGKGHSPEKEIVDDAIRYAEKKDVLIVHASGNSAHDLDDDTDDDENYPCDLYRKPKGFLFFKKKRAKNYLSIGASAPSDGPDMVADFSNYGKENVDLFAPGVMMLSTTPDDTYEIKQGTSMSAPVISGVAAIIRSYFPTLKATQVKDAIMQSATPIDTEVTIPGGEDLVPFYELSVTGGIVNIPEAIRIASAMKGKKKLKKKEKRPVRA